MVAIAQNGRHCSKWPPLLKMATTSNLDVLADKPKDQS